MTRREATLRIRVGWISGLTIAHDVDVLRQIRRDYDGTFALNAWAGRPGRVALGDAVELLDAPILLTRPALGRCA